MTTAKTERIDVPLVLGRLVPTAEFHWKGNGWGTYAEIGEWRSPDIPKPTEAEVYAEWDRYRAEQVLVNEQAAGTRAQVAAAQRDIHDLRLEDLEHLTPEQLRSLLVAILQRMGAIQPDGRVALD